MAKPGSSNASGAGAFEGEEPTEVMPARSKSAAPPPEPEPENKDKQYVAPCEIPAARVPMKEQEGAKIVINVSEKRSDGVAGERARRRAPTVKLSRAEVDLAKLKTRGIEPTLPDQPAFQIDVTLDELEDDETAKRPVGYIEPAKPIAESPRALPVSSRPPPSSSVGLRALEPPPTSMQVGASIKPERSRAPWIFVAVLLLGGGVAAAVFVTQNKSAPAAAEPPPPSAAAKPAPSGTATSTAPAAAPTEAAPASSASEPSGSATGEPSAEPSAASTTASVAGIPPAPVRNPSLAGRPAPTAPLPRATAKPPPPKSDIPSGI